MASNYKDTVKKVIEEITKDELQARGDFLTPWAKYPDIQRYSIGWRMGYGEKYMWAWDEWFEKMGKDQRLGYLKKYAPIPIEWLDWVSNRMGFDIFPSQDSSSENDLYAGIKWLEKEGLADFLPFEKWYKDFWKKK